MVDTRTLMFQVYPKSGKNGPVTTRRQVEVSEIGYQSLVLEFKEYVIQYKYQSIDITIQDYQGFISFLKEKTELLTIVPCSSARSKFPVKSKENCQNVLSNYFEQLLPHLENQDRTYLTNPSESGKGKQSPTYTRIINKTLDLSKRVKQRLHIVLPDEDSSEFEETFFYSHESNKFTFGPKKKVELHNFFTRVLEPWILDIRNKQKSYSRKQHQGTGATGAKTIAKVDDGDVKEAVPKKR